MNEYQRLCELSRVNKRKKNVYIHLYDLGYDRCYKCVNLETHPVSSKDLIDSASLRKIYWVTGWPKVLKCLPRWPPGLKRRSWPFCYWDSWFESRSRHGCLFLCFCVVLSYVSSGLCDGLITRPTESYCVSK